MRSRSGKNFGQFGRFGSRASGPAGPNRLRSPIRATWKGLRRRQIGSDASFPQPASAHRPVYGLMAWIYDTIALPPPWGPGPGLESCFSRPPAATLMQVQGHGWHGNCRPCRIHLSALPMLDPIMPSHHLATLGRPHSPGPGLASSSCNRWSMHLVGSRLAGPAMLYKILLHLRVCNFASAPLCTPLRLCISASLHLPGSESPFAPSSRLGIHGSTLPRQNPNKSRKNYLHASCCRHDARVIHACYLPRP